MSTSGSDVPNSSTTNAYIKELESRIANLKLRNKILRDRLDLPAERCLFYEEVCKLQDQVKNSIVTQVIYTSFGSAQATHVDELRIHGQVLCYMLVLRVDKNVWADIMITSSLIEAIAKADLVSEGEPIPVFRQTKYLVRD